MRRILFHPSEKAYENDKGRELSISEDWVQLKMLYDRMELPTGQVVRPQQILAGIALLGGQAELEIKTSTYLLGVARAIARIKK